MAQAADGSDVKQYKEAECLKGYSLTGGLTGALSILLCMPLGFITLLGLLLKEFLKSPSAFFSRKKRDPAALPLPAGLEGLVHENIDVGGGVSIHAVSFGRQPHKPLLLFLHGVPEHWYCWRRELAAFRKDYDVVAIDLRGFGLSSKPVSVGAYSLSRLVRDVPAVVRALGRSSCTLVAHDWGGALAWAVAGTFPEVVDRLAVVSAPHWLLYKRNFSLEQALRSYYMLWFGIPVMGELLMTHRDANIAYDIWGKAGTGNPSSPLTSAHITPNDIEWYKWGLLEPGAATGQLNYYRALLLMESGLLKQDPEVERGMRRQLPMPVCVVWGAKDHALITKNLDGVNLVAPRAKVHILEKCTHWVHSDCPDDLQRILRDWMAENPLPGQQQAAKK